MNVPTIVENITSFNIRVKYLVYDRSHFCLRWSLPPRNVVRFIVGRCWIRHWWSKKVITNNDNEQHENIQQCACWWHSTITCNSKIFAHTICCLYGLNKPSDAFKTKQTYRFYECFANTPMVFFLVEMPFSSEIWCAPFKTIPYLDMWPVATKVVNGPRFGHIRHIIAGLVGPWAPAIWPNGNNL